MSEKCYVMFSQSHTRSAIEYDILNYGCPTFHSLNPIFVLIRLKIIRLMFSKHFAETKELCFSLQ